MSASRTYPDEIADGRCGWWARSANRPASLGARSSRSSPSDTLRRSGRHARVGQWVRQLRRAGEILNVRPRGSSRPSWTLSTQMSALFDVCRDRLGVEPICR
jgi:hypothetical protein